MRWLVPLAVAGVVVMYVAVRPVIAPYFPLIGSPSQQGQAPAAELVVADARPQERPVDAAAPDASGAGQFSPLKTSERGGAGRMGETTPGAPQPKAGRGEPLIASGNPASKDTVLTEKTIVATGAEALNQRAATANDARSAAAPPVDVMAVQAPPPPAARPASQPATALPAAALAGVAGRQRAARIEASSPPEIVSPDGSAVWVIGPGGRLSRSTDRGVSWQPQTSGVSVDLLAGSAPSASVCWMVGRNATVIVTTDGTRWSSRPFPERVDLVAVDAVDARAATVTTRDGRRFATLDGGATWSPK